MSDPKPPFEMLGAEAPVCADGVCAVPDEATVPEETVAGRSGGPPEPAQ